MEMDGWISVADEKPTYYKSVIIFDGSKVHYEWHRMADEHGEIYVSLNTDRIIEGVTHWRPLLEGPKSNQCAAEKK